MNLPSQHQIGHKVTVFNQLGVVKRVTFDHQKVTYDIALDEGGEQLRNVDSCFVLLVG